MPKIKYKSIKLRDKSLKIVDQANDIIEEYVKQGYDLTLRQLYYQFVARDLLENNQKNYKKLGSIINDARLAGYIDWNRIEDRTRNVESVTTWQNPSSIIQAVASQFKIDLWEGQPYRVEVWIEKEALAGVFERVCRELRISYLSCRGYTSQSEMWRASQRLEGYIADDQTPIILHFGDHDPSGMDMSRDISDRLRMFMGGTEFERLALNMDQIEEHKPPPNPAKDTDVRASAYILEYGDQSWELDALDPAFLSNLVRERVTKLIDRPKWDARVEEEKEHRRLLDEVSSRWDELTENL